MNKKRILNEDEMRDFLRNYVTEKAGGNLRIAAERLCTTKQNLSLILSGKRTIGEDLSWRLGFERKETEILVEFWIPTNLL